MLSYSIERMEGFQTHYLEWNPIRSTDRLPVICIHGNLSNARMFRWIGDALSSRQNSSPRRVIAIDMRGCGDSGLPEKGFTLQHFASDIASVLDHVGIHKAHFIAYSRGVAYALQYALLHPGSVHGLVIGDYPSYYSKLSQEWVHTVEKSYEVYNSWDDLYHAITESTELSREEFEARKEEFYVEQVGGIFKRYAEDFPARLQLESADYDLTPALEKIKGKLLIVKGNKKGSLLNEKQINVYQNYDSVVVRVEQASHDVFDPREQVKEALIDYFTSMQ